jgi:two-component system CheB/CheR fusion protein
MMPALTHFGEYIIFNQLKGVQMAKKTGRSPKKKIPAKKAARPQEKKISAPLSFPVVAVGASAGGVEASCELLKNISADLGMAYVFVHHLSASYESHLPEILQRHTSMKVRSVTNRLKIAPNEVYVIPSNTFMIINDGHLMIRARTKKDTHAIDHFMESLSSVYQHNAIGILLSGTASDGTAGLKAIKLEGGITFSQDESAKHPEMSEHAQEAGYVDYVLPPNRIAEELAAFIQHPYALASPADELARNEKEIKKILAIILQKFDVDFFSHYKRTTVNRRIMRRMALNDIKDFAEYAKKLRSDHQEVHSLYNDFLINVTSFFREPNFYQALKKTVFPQLVKDRKSTDSIRIWIPGCATGEEAYSTAIAITEFLEEKKLSIPVQIFSTDLDERAINKARVGTYSKNAVDQITPQWIKTFFTKIDGQYQIAKQIRDMCTFSVHNLMKDPPFSRIDLVSCQNVLIYIEAAPQRKILQAFHYALKPTGFLLLGKSESIGNALDIFQPLEKDSKLYKKKLQTVLPRFEFSVRPHATYPALHQPFSEHRTESDIEREFDKVLLALYVPASILVNKDLEILRFRGQTSLYMQPPSGKASFNLLKMLKEELIFEIRGLLQKVKRTNLPSSKEGISIDSENMAVTIEVVPIKSLKEIYYFIVFKPDTMEIKSRTKKSLLSKQDQPGRIAKLEQQLRDARDQVRTITEDFDVSREELQSANEEILSANEELQSINEELETSKEELQSANEELTTINEELQTRIDELKQSRDFSEAIIETIHGPLVVVSGQMRIRTANKAFYEFFKLKQEETEGRYINELNNGDWDIPALTAHLREIFPRKVHFKDFEIDHNFPVIGHRMMTVNAHRLKHGKDKETQILLAFHDITPFRKAEHSLREAEEQLKLALQGGQVGTWSWNIKTNEVSGSREGAILFGLKEGRFFSTYEQWMSAVHPDDKKETQKQITKAQSNKAPLDIEFRILTPDGDVRWVLLKANIYSDNKDKAERMMGINIDITERKRAIEAIAESEKRFHALSDNAPVMIWMTDADKNCNYLNQTWLSFTGKDINDELGKGWYKGIHPEDLEGFLAIYDDAFENHKPFKTDYRLRRHDGEYRWILAHGVPRFVNSHTFAGFIGTSIDITERINLEKQKDDFMTIASHELKTPVTSIKAYAQILEEKFRKLGDEHTTGMLGRLDKQVDKMTELINTLLDVARIQSGQMEYEYEPVSVNPFIVNIAEENQRIFPNHAIELQLDKDDTIVMDKLRITQVLNNLISNAVKYSPDANKIIITTKSDDNQFDFTVQDFGIGIPKNKHEQIFDRFFRVSESEGNRVSGLGLGLFISAQIIRQQGGKIWLDSLPGKGSSFSFSLPKDQKK